MKIQESIRDFICSHIVKNHNGQEPENTVSLIETGILDSLGIIKLISFVERRFLVKVSNTDITPDNFETIYAISSFVESKMAAHQESRI